MGLLVPPGQWGEKGADIACGEGQPLGIPLSGGGPYFGFLCCRKKDVRQMPGRVVGKTVDKDGNPGYVLTLQAREQHIRRGKATSNICTNQGLLVTAATLYLSLVGPLGLKKVAARCHQLTEQFKRELTKVAQVKIVFESFFHELVLRLPIAADLFLQKMSEQGFAAGFALEKEYPQLKDCIVVCLTETKTEQDIKAYIATMQTLIERASHGDF
jgi:glycine dehydrogenase subunit 1